MAAVHHRYAAVRGRRLFYRKAGPAVVLLHRVPDETLVSPDTWQHDHALLSRPGNDLVQLALFADYGTNPPLYPKLHAWLREDRVPVLAIWGRNDPGFGPEGPQPRAAHRHLRRYRPGRPVRLDQHVPDRPDPARRRRRTADLTRLRPGLGIEYSCPWKDSC